jgi:hypothetical protein
LPSSTKKKKETKQQKKDDLGKNYEDGVVLFEKSFQMALKFK